MARRTKRTSSQRKAAPKPKTAVIYSRFSCSKQREASIEDQLRVCRAWCAREGYEVVGEYCDYAMSGTTDERPEFQRMVGRAGEAEIVLVYMMDRFSRDIYDAPIYKKKLAEAGCRVVSATEAMPDGPEAMLVSSLYEAMAAMESAHTSQRTKRGMEGNAMKCMHNGVSTYGYDLGDDGYYHVNEEQAEFVRQAFAMRAQRMSYGLIAQKLAAR
ncbi:MAG: recombinase family protein, partial [Coriobacteriales bacterium]|nr:recombinase family protein [Coriobacteriales bacterium]